MKITDLEAAIKEAERFLTRARDLRRAAQRTEDTRSLYSNPKEQGAVRRSSLDLSRALADLRRS